MGDEAVEFERVGGQAGIDECRDESGGARQAFHIDTYANALAHQQVAWIRDAGRAGIGGQRHLFGLLDLADDVL